MNKSDVRNVEMQAGRFILRREDLRGRNGDFFRVNLAIKQLWRGEEMSHIDRQIERANKKVDTIVGELDEIRKEAIAIANSINLEMIEASQAKLSAAESDLNIAQQNYDNVRIQYNINNASSAMLEQAIRALRDATTARDEARSELNRLSN